MGPNTRVRRDDPAWRLPGRWAVAIAGLLLIGASVAIAQEPATPLNRFLVVPFENTSHEGRLYWLSEASAVLLSDDFGTLGVPVIDRDERLRAFERLHVPPVAMLSHATVVKVGELVGASQVIVGSFQLEGDSLVVRGRSIRLDTGRLVPEVVERGSLADMFAIFVRVARALAPASIPAPTSQWPAVHPPLAAFESYIKGLLAETPSTQLKYLDEALKVAPAWHRVRLAQWVVDTEQGNHQRALQDARAVPDGTPWTRRARFDAALSLIRLGQLDEAFATLSALQQAGPSPGILNNLGVVQLRRGNPPATGRATQWFGQAVAIDSDDPALSFNLGYAASIEKDLPTAVHWLRETVRRNPADADAHYVLAAALQATGATAEAARERELAGQLSTAYAERLKQPGSAALPRALERISPDVDAPVGSRVETVLVANEQREQRDVAQYYLERGRRLYQQEQDREAALELRRVLYLQPYQAEALRLLGQVYQRTGRLPEAIDTLKVAVWAEDSAASRTALAEAYLQSRDEPAARAEAERALKLDPSNQGAQRVLSRLPKPPAGA